MRSQPLIFALGCARPNLSLATESSGNARQPVSDALCSLPQLANGQALAKLVAKETSAWKTMDFEKKVDFIPVVVM